jgi:hypothetical protein
VSHETRAHLQVRLLTNFRVYWDQILFDTSQPAHYTLLRMEPVEARLSERGFSAEVPGIGAHAPITYDYANRSIPMLWKAMPGMYTRTGDVRPLLLASDDRFVISTAGDEIALAFDAAALPPLPHGWRRTFLLYANGFSKEMNLHSASPDRLEPLPFHAMSRYPYRFPEHFPATPALDRYRRIYNTRPVGGPLPPLEIADGSLRATK